MQNTSTLLGSDCSTVSLRDCEFGIKDLFQPHLPGYYHHNAAEREDIRGILFVTKSEEPDSGVGRGSSDLLSYSTISAIITSHQIICSRSVFAFVSDLSQ